MIRYRNSIFLCQGKESRQKAENGSVNLFFLGGRSILSEILRTKDDL